VVLGSWDPAWKWSLALVFKAYAPSVCGVCALPDGLPCVHDTAPAPHFWHRPSLIQVPQAPWCRALRPDPVPEGPLSASLPSCSVEVLV
jgi:hypothetical protein